MHLRVGTSGYSYKEWKGGFYPDDIKADRMLQFYATKLPAVEINNTFYRLPRSSVLETWAAQVPEAFRFSIKASRRITHMKRLKDAGDETGYLLETLGALGDRLGVVLFQLPPNLKKDLPRLEAFLELIGDVRAGFEFRHESWLDDDVLDALRARNCALCIADTDDDDPGPKIDATADWGYLRLRRATYEPAALKAWIDAVQAQSWSEAYVFFKHEDEGSGPELAAAFLKLAGS